MPSSPSLETIRRQLLKEFVEPFENQQHKDDLRSRNKQEQLLWDGCGISKTSMWRAFRNCRHETDAAIVACKSVYDFLKNHWRVDEEGWFQRIGEIKSTFHILPHRVYPQKRVLEALRDCDSDVRMIDTYPSFLLNSSEHPEETNLLQWVSENGKRLKLLVLDPTGKGMEVRMNSGIAAMRSPFKFRDRILEGLAELYEEMQKHPDTLEVRLIDEFPAMHGVILQDCAFFGLHYAHELSQKASFFELTDRANHVYIDFHTHFESLWNKRSQKLDKNLLDRLEKKKRQANHIWESLNGMWEIYFHDRWGEEVQPPTTSPLGKISSALLDIAESGNDAPLMARLFFHDAQKGVVQTLDCEVRFERLIDSEFAHFSFTDHHQLSIRLIVRCKPEQKGKMLIGHWTLLNSFDLNSSGALLYRPEKKSPFQPAKFDIPLDKIEDIGISSSLAFHDHNSFSLHKFKLEFEKNRNSKLKLFAGVYKMYAHGRKKDRKGIQLNILRITPYGFVEYKNQRFTAYGIAMVKDNNLHLRLTHSTQDYRTGYFILSATDTETNPGDVYTGVFLGIGFQVRMPIARRILFVYSDKTFEEESPDFYWLKTAEHENLHEGIRKALTGRVKNLVGFLRSKGNIFTLQSLYDEWKESEVLEEDVFVKAARDKALDNKKKEAIDLIERAVEHGFCDLIEFERDIAASAIAQLILSDEKYLRIKRFVYGRDSDAAENVPGLI